MSTSNSPKKLTRRRKISFSILILVIVLAVIEGLSHLTYQLIYDDIYRRKGLRKLTTDSWAFAGEETGVPGFLASLVIHPYFGFGADADGDAKQGFGFIQQTAPVDSAKHRDKFRVLFLGGSVALQLTQKAADKQSSHLEYALRESFRKKGIDTDVWIYNAALPGFKQPQQVMAYTFLLTQGAEFDLVLNLDGFNEMTLAMFEGLSSGLHPAYPRSWNLMLGNQLTSSKLRKIAQLMKVREEQSSLIAFAHSNPLARPRFVGLFITHQVVANERRAQELVAEIEQSKQHEKLDLEEGGVPFDYSNEEDAYKYLAQLWMRCSVLLAQLAQSNNAEYLHLFQPNQYLNNSKIFSELEREKFYIPDQLFGKIYRSAYPYFSAQMNTLLESGEWFVDSSMIYKDEEQTVYSDACCHLNEYGLETLAELIANEIAAKSKKTKALYTSQNP